MRGRVHVEGGSVEKDEVDYSGGVVSELDGQEVKVLSELDMGDGALAGGLPAEACAIDVVAGGTGVAGRRVSEGPREAGCAGDFVVAGLALARAGEALFSRGVVELSRRAADDILETVEGRLREAGAATWKGERLYFF